MNTVTQQLTAMAAYLAGLDAAVKRVAFRGAASAFRFSLREKWRDGAG